MSDRETLRALEENWLDPDYGGDMHLAGDMEYVEECYLCGDYVDHKETIDYGGRKICFFCAERIAEEYREAK